MAGARDAAGAIVVDACAAPAFAIVVLVPVGSADAPGAPGLAHVLEHALCLPAFSAGAGRELPPAWALNAGTSLDATTFEMVGPPEAPQLAAALRTLRAMLTAGLRGVSPAAFARERTVVGEELSFRGLEVAQPTELEALYGREHPYAVSPMGTLADIRACTRAGAAALHALYGARRWYVSVACPRALVEGARSAAAAAFREETRAELPSPGELPAFAGVPVPRIIAYGSGTPQVELVFAGLPSSDARVPAAAMAAWFLGGFAGPLMRRLRGDRGWVYNLRSELVVLRQRALPLIVVFSTRDAPGCAAEVLRVLTALHTDAAWDAAARAGFAGLRERFAREEASKFLRPRDLANRAVELAWQGYTVRGWMAAIEAVGPDELRDALREGWRLNAAGAVARGCRSPRAAVAKLRRVLGGSPRKRSASG